MNAVHYFQTARDREYIRRQRLAGFPAPWSSDPIFQQWRFTNVHRENDKTTAWFREHIRQPLSDRVNINSAYLDLLAQRVALVEATIIFRWFNRIESMERIKDLLLEGWNTEEARRRLSGVAPLVTGAFMIHSPYGMHKLDGLLWAIDQARPKLLAMTERWGDSQEEAWRDLCTLDNMGSFSAGEVIWDLRWTPILSKALDISSWTIAGPGCTRGLGYVVADDPSKYQYGSKSDQKEMLTVMQDLLVMSRDTDYWPSHWEPWELHETEMWACEYAKYRSAQAGGRLKRRF